MDPIGYNLLAKAEGASEVDLDDLEIEFSKVDVKKYSAEMYDIMCQTV